MLDWLSEHRVLMEWAVGLSVLLALGSVIVIPILVTRIPEDYFLERRAPVHPFARRHPVVRALYHVAKTLVGGGLVLVGLALLVLPGQGLLTIAAGVLLLDFPGKRALELWMVRRRAILKAFNWIRRKARKPPLAVDDLPDPDPPA